MNDPIDVLMLTGYLGAGKSTLLQGLMKLPETARRDPALLINEFGQQGVDGRLFDDAGCPLYEINRGSLFCICTHADLLAALEQLAAQRPGVVLIEATGVAETRDFESLLEEPHLHQQFRVRANVCVVDAMNFTKIAPFLKAARNQVAAADGLVINKVDLASEQELQTLETLLTKMNPRAAQVRATRGEVTYAFLDSLSHRRTTEALALAQPEAIHASSYRSIKPVDRGEFEQAVDSLGKQLLRLKGHILFSDSEHYEFVETVCGKMSVKPAEAEVRATSFTAIAFGLPDGQLDRVFTPFDDTE